KILLLGYFHYSGYFIKYFLFKKKFGLAVEKEAKLKAKQIRFLMYRGFEMDAIIKAITRKENDF
ncbi:MAG: RecX family transcriptional regulator, partial [Acinetobacter sp.]